MNLWGGSLLSEDLTSTMLTIVKTSRRQGQPREGVSEGSPSAKRRADEQKSDIRLSSRVEWAPDHEDHPFALYGKSGGCVVTVHVLIRGDLLGERSMVAMGVGLRTESKDSGLPPNPTVTMAACARVILGTIEQKSAAVVVAMRAGQRKIAKDQRSRTGQRLFVLDTCVACVKREVSIGV